MSRILDRGAETLKLYGSFLQTDILGNEQWVADNQNPITLRVTASTDRQQTAEVNGQLAIKMIKVSFRGIPGVNDFSRPQVWDRAEFRGEQWDVRQPPANTRVTRALRHTYLILVSRNQEA